MPCYLQGVDLESTKKNKSILKQLQAVYVDRAMLEKELNEQTTMTEEEFNERSGKGLNIDYWQEDVVYYKYRRDLYILDIHELIKLYGHSLKISSFEVARELISKYLSRYIHDLFFPYNENEFKRLGTLFCKNIIIIYSFIV